MKASVPPVTALVVDDEHKLVELIRGYLEREGFAVLVAYDGPTAVQLARSERPDVVVLDLMLPGFDGLEVCRRLRQFSDAYVIMLTAKAEEIDKLVGLGVGADDYLTKPFSPRELVARIKAMLRRPRRPKMGEEGTRPPQRLGTLVIDRLRREVSRAAVPIELTAREFDLLALLADQPGRVFTRAQILDRLWSEDTADDHVVEVHVANLRRKLEPNPSEPFYVQTVRGVGYRFRPDLT